MNVFSCGKDLIYKETPLGQKPFSRHPERTATRSGDQKIHTSWGQIPGSTVRSLEIDLLIFFFLFVDPRIASKLDYL
jgi:hypothetical protein